MSYTQSPSPNFSGRKGFKPELIVIHCTDGFFPSDMQFLQNPTGGAAGPVSAHFVVSPTGAVHQLVDEANSAWHAGRVDKPTAKLKKNVFGVYENPNLYSVGIEVSLRAGTIMPKDQELALRKLVREIAGRHNIPLDRDHVVGHREIFSAKTCPSTINIDEIIKEIGGSTLSPTPTDKEKIKEKMRYHLNEFRKLVDSI